MTQVQNLRQVLKKDPSVYLSFKCLISNFFTKKTSLRYVHSKTSVFILFLRIQSPTYETNAQEPFATEIQKFQVADSAVAPVTGQIMLYGSSTFRFWKTAETDCAFKSSKELNGLTTHSCHYRQDDIKLRPRSNF